MNDNTLRIDYLATRLIACATVIEEMLNLMPPGLAYHKMEFGLHADPDKLRKELQLEIDSSDSKVTTILLGYGLCSRAMTGLISETRTIIVPKVDDCIGVFLGSDAEYQEQHRKEPGTLYQTKGWIEANKQQAAKSFNSLKDLIARYGEKRAAFIHKQLFKNYTRMAFINTGNYEIEHYRAESRAMAAEMDLKYEEIKGSNALVKKLLWGPWDTDFVISPPGRALSFLDFRT